jgi:hypothetical protein
LGPHLRFPDRSATDGEQRPIEPAISYAVFPSFSLWFPAVTVAGKWQARFSMACGRPLTDGRWILGS